MQNRSERSLNVQSSYLAATTMALQMAQLPVPVPVDYDRKFTLVLHGGAGNITRQTMTPEKEKAYTTVLTIALQTGFAVLKNGGSSLDAVEATIRVLEDSPLFNAGKGAVFTHDGTHELDASIMDGRTLNAGAVAGVTTVRNPITAARCVLDKSAYVLLTGTGAEAFAKEHDLELVDPRYFHTETRWKALQKELDAEKTHELSLPSKPEKESDLPDASLSLPIKPTTVRSMQASWAPDPTVWGADQSIFDEGKKYGTVGCVALDQFGNLAAATSTGGVTNKRYGRVGDTPLIGAGTYANNATCAVSATGQGEAFIRAVAGHDISALMDYKGLSVQEAADEVVMRKLLAQGGEGGVIAIDRNGNIAMPFTTDGMYRAYIKADGSSEVLLYEA